jgi:prepilin-type N-terminal cleavage/methylation domain-containing protein
VRRRGFSLVEVMVSVGILGVGLLGIVNLHTSSIIGLSRGQHIAMAQEVAMQQTELLETEATIATGSLESVLPNCPASRSTDPIGCQLSTTEYAPIKQCTMFLSDPNIPDPSGGFPSVLPPGSGDASTYRMDTVIAQHPDTLNHPGALMVTVSVCWSDDQQNVHQISTSRVLVPGT